MAAERHLILDNTGFSVRGARWAYSEIEKLYFYRVQIQKTLNFISAGIDHKAELKIYVQSRANPLIVKTGTRYGTIMGFSFGKNNSERLAAKYAELARRSFGQRMKKYASALEEFGYFFYDDVKVFGDGLIQGDGWSFNLNTDRPILKVPFAIFYERKRAGFFGSSKRHAINTTIDQDIFFAILYELFGLRW